MLKQVPVRIDPETHKQLKLIAVDKGMTLQSIFAAMIDDFLRKYKT